MVSLESLTYSPEQVAEFCQVTRRTVYNWISDGHLKARKVGPRYWVIDRFTLEAFLGLSPSPDAVQSPQPVPAVASPVTPPTVLKAMPSSSSSKKKSRRR